jgi:translation initiation factor 2 subunit 1
MSSSRFPEVGELVIGTVTKVERHGVRVKLEEYDGLEAFVPISEISLKWVRNIRDYLREGQRAVLKVIRSSPTTLEVDASLRRVSQRERAEKMMSWNQLVKVRRMLTLLSEKTGIDMEMIEEGLVKPAAERHIDLYRLFEEISSGDEVPAWVRLPEEAKTALAEMCRREIKRVVTAIKRVVKIRATRGGVDAIRAAAEEAMKLGARGERVTITTIGAPRYLVRAEAETAERAEQLLGEAIQALTKTITQHGGSVEVLAEGEKK